MFDDLIGKPFASGGRGPESFDCWGLVREARRRLNLPLPEDIEVNALEAASVSAEIETAKKDGHWHEITVPTIGCVVAIRNHHLFVNHVGVYLGNGLFMHVLAKICACQDRITSPAWSRRIVGYYEYVG